MEIPTPSVVLTKDTINAYYAVGRELYKYDVKIPMSNFENSPPLPPEAKWCVYDSFIVLEIEPRIWNIKVKFAGAKQFSIYELPMPYVILLHNASEIRGKVFFRTEPLTSLKDEVFRTILTNVKDDNFFCFDQVGQGNSFVEQALNHFNLFFATKFSNGNYFCYNGLLPEPFLEWAGGKRTIWIDGEKYFTSWQAQTLDFMLAAQYSSAGNLIDHIEKPIAKNFYSMAMRYRTNPQQV